MSNVKCQMSNVSNGFTLVEVLVGTFLILLVFMAIFGVYQLGMKVVSQSKSRIIATAVTNQKIEQIRNLPYQSIGTVGGSPEGDIEPTETAIRGGVEFTIKTSIDYITDEADGLSMPEDNCIYDYKRVLVAVSWSGRFSGEVSLTSDIAPKNEVQECEETGGILLVNVFDAQGFKVNGAEISVEDISGPLSKNCTTSSDRECYIALPTSETSENYKVEVSKTDYSADLTFGTGDIYNGETIIAPEKPHTTILEGQITEKSFSIDELSSFSVSSKSSRGKESFKDEFINLSKVSESNNIEIQDGEIKLAKSNGDYYGSGYLVSNEISPADLKSWHQISFKDSEPENTDISYRVFYYQNPDWILVPDIDLPGNSTGFNISPIDLSILDINSYPGLKIKAGLTTSDPQQTPSLDEWELSYLTKVSWPITSVPFNLRGSKIVGKDSEEKNIYKYSDVHITDGSGNINISNLEWDLYYFSVDKEETELDLIETEPTLQPISLEPGTSQIVILYLEAEDTLLTKVQDVDTGKPIFSASVRLYQGDLDQTQWTNENGETFFIPLESKTHNIEVAAEGYTPYIGQISVSGETSTTINLTLSPQ